MGVREAEDGMCLCEGVGGGEGDYCVHARSVRGRGRGERGNEVREEKRGEEVADAGEVAREEGDGLRVDGREGTFG